MPDTPVYDTLIGTEQLAALYVGQRPSMVFDCSFDMAQPLAGRAQYESAHLPAAVYADLEQDLSAAPGEAAPASGGRHPLPQRARFAQWLSDIGFAHTMQAVVYDRSSGAWCARLWWMLQWAGHRAAAVLDGGLAAWQATGLPVTAEVPAPRAASRFVPGAPLQQLVDVQQVQQALGSSAQTIIDARARERYRGEVEPLDPVAGHIPGALNRPFGDNIALDGRFKPAELLRAEFEQLLAGRDPGSVVHQCGSGVSAVPNLLAMRIAGFAPTRLFAGSWSQWCSDPTRPVARGSG